MIIVTGSTGNVGAKTAELLRQSGEHVRGLCRNPTHPDDVSVNLADPDAVEAAIKGARAVFANVPAVHNQLDMEKNLIVAAKKTNTERYLRLSSLGANANGTDTVARIHGQAEQLLEESGLNFTHIRANYFMQMFLAQAENISKNNSFTICAVNSANVGFIDTRDIAAVSTVALSEQKYAGKTLHLTGPELMTFPSAVNEISKAIGRQINYCEMNSEDFYKVLLDNQVSEFLAEHVIGLYTRIGTGASAITTEEVAEIIGRQPKTFHEFAHDHADQFR